MNSWKKTNEAYFGDSFDRSSTATAYANKVAYDTAVAAIDKCVATADCSVNSLYDLVDYAKADNGISLNLNQLSTKADISTLQESIQHITCANR